MNAERVRALFAASFGGILLTIVLCYSFSTLSSSVQAKAGESTTLEIYSGMSVGNDLLGLNALIGVFTATYTDTSVVVSYDYEELVDRLVTGDPPDGFQMHCGAQLIADWIEPGDYVSPISQLWSDQGWLDKVPQGLLDMIDYQGELYCVPLNIHRSNVLWYNRQVFSDTGQTPPTTFIEFFAVAEALESAGKIPLALGETWPAVHLMETILAGSLGAESYRGLWDGTTFFNGPEVIEAMEIFDQMMDYVNPDHGSLTWEQAMDLVGSGSAGMTIMGDWAEGYLESLGLVPGVDFGWVPVPGGVGSFLVVNDSYVMPRNPAHPQGALNWLKTVGSLEGQEALSQFKSSIPPRLDANPGLFSLYHQQSMADYAADELLPSFVHGMAAPPSFLAATLSLFEDLMATGDIDSTASAWQQAACAAGFGRCYIFVPMIQK